MTKVLIIRFSSIGDIVLTTPVIRNLKQQIYGEVEIHYLTKQAFKSILDLNPYISKIYTIEKSTNEVIDSLQDESYDYIIDLHRNLRSSRVKRSLKSLSFTFNKLNWEKWLLVNFGIDKLPDTHIVERYMETLKAFGIKNDNQGLDFFLSEADKKLKIPSTHSNGFMVLGIGAAHWRKKLRLKQYISTCEQIEYPIILVGGKSEKDEGDQIAAKFQGRVWNAAGRTSIGESAFLVYQARVVITPDTGIMHIAAAFKKPIISFWGATIPKFGMYPYQNENLNKIVQAEHLDKRPCSKLGTKCKYKPCKCIDEMPLDQIVESANLQIEPSAQ